MHLLIVEQAEMKSTVSQPWRRVGELFDGTQNLTANLFGHVGAQFEDQAGVRGRRGCSISSIRAVLFAVHRVWVCEVAGKFLADDIYDE